MTLSSHLGGGSGARGGPGRARLRAPRRPGLALLLLVLGALFSAGVGCDSSESHLGKTKTFLRECDESAPCAGSEICACFCTVACDEVSTCAEELARLGADIPSDRIVCRAPSCQSTAVDAPALAGVCDVSCRADDECASLGAGQRCAGGFCRAELPASRAASSCPSGTRGVLGVPGAPGELCFERFEVTVFDYGQCVDAGDCDAPSSGDFFVQGRSDHPIQLVSAEQAQAYCGARGRRLPTREEWAFAARNGEVASQFPWGDAAPTAADSPARACALTTSESCAVGSHPAGNTSSGLSDLAGNVAELVTEAGAFCAAGGSFRATEAEPAALEGVSCVLFGGAADDVGFRCVVAP